MLCVSTLILRAEINRNLCCDRDSFKQNRMTRHACGNEVMMMMMTDDMANANFNGDQNQNGTCYSY